MAIKTARDVFTRGEILDILRQNVAMYHNEPGFADYLAELGLYLLDQAYCVSGERCQDLPALMERMSAAVNPPPEVPSARQPAPAGPTDAAPSQAPAKPARSTARDDDEPSTNKLRLAAFDAVIKRPPAASPPTPVEEKPTGSIEFSTSSFRPDFSTSSLKPKGLGSEAKPKDKGVDDNTGEELEALDSSAGNPDTTRTFLTRTTRQLVSPVALTPMPDEGAKQADVEIRKAQMGRAEVFKPVKRTNKRAENATLCPVCGVEVLGSRRCPSCGRAVK